MTPIPSPAHTDGAEENPVQQAIRWLESQGFTRAEATHLCQAIRADRPEKLWQDAPVWLEWCAKIKREHDCIVALAAMGAITVEIGPGGIEDLRVALRKELLPDASDASGSAAEPEHCPHEPPRA